MQRLPPGVIEVWDRKPSAGDGGKMSKRIRVDLPGGGFRYELYQENPQAEPNPLISFQQPSAQFMGAQLVGHNPFVQPQQPFIAQHVVGLAAFGQPQQPQLQAMGNPVILAQLPQQFQNAPRQFQTPSHVQPALYIQPKMDDLRPIRNDARGKIIDTKINDLIQKRHPKRYPLFTYSAPFKPEVIEQKTIYDWRQRYPADPVGVRIILSKDSRSRKRMNWSLVPFTDFHLYLNDVDYTEPKPSTPAYYGTPAVIGSYIPSDELYCIKPELQAPLTLAVRFPTDAAGKTTKFDDITPHINLLYTRFPFLPTLLENHRGKIAVCGGSLTRLLSSVDDDGSPYAIKDVDIFFHSVTQQEATEILSDCVASICHVYAGKIGRVRVEHKEFVTNVVIDTDETKMPNSTSIYTGGWTHGKIPPICYQFVHRIYPTMAHIIGGFDLGPSMLAFDGEMIYATELGAWCIAKDTAIIDTTRLSLSFDYRVIKLRNMGYGVVFPGLRAVDMYDPDYHKKKNDAKRLIINKAFVLLKKLGLFVYDTNGGESTGLDVLEEYTAYIGDKRMVGGVEIRGGGTGSDINSRTWVGVANQEVTSAKYLKHVSDYSSFYIIDASIDKAISTMLRCNNFDAIMTYASFDNDVSYDNAYSSFTDLFNHPVVVYDPKYRDFVENYMKGWNIDHERNRTPKRDTARFAEYSSKIYTMAEELINNKYKPYNSNPEFKAYVDSVVVIMEQRMIDNAKIAADKLMGLHWMDQNPERQWTASINPTMLNPRQYYGDNYVSFWIGIPCEVETTLRAIRKFRSESPFSRFDRNLFDMILQYVCRAYIYNTMQDEYNYILYTMDRRDDLPPEKEALVLGPEYRLTVYAIPGTQQPQQLFNMPTQGPFAQQPQIQQAGPFGQMNLAQMMGNQLLPAVHPAQPQMTFAEMLANTQRNNLQQNLQQHLQQTAVQPLSPRSAVQPEFSAFAPARVLTVEEYEISNIVKDDATERATSFFKRYFPDLPTAEEMLREIQSSIEAENLKLATRNLTREQNLMIINATSDAFINERSRQSNRRETQSAQKYPQPPQVQPFNPLTGQFIPQQSVFGTLGQQPQQNLMMQQSTSAQTLQPSSSFIQNSPFGQPQFQQPSAFVSQTPNFQVEDPKKTNNLKARVTQRATQFFEKFQNTIPFQYEIDNEIATTVIDEANSTNMSNARLIVTVREIFSSVQSTRAKTLMNRPMRETPQMPTFIQEQAQQYLQSNVAPEQHAAYVRIRNETLPRALAFLNGFYPNVPTQDQIEDERQKDIKNETLKSAGTVESHNIYNGVIEAYNEAESDYLNQPGVIQPQVTMPSIFNPLMQQFQQPQQQFQPKFQPQQQFQQTPPQQQYQPVAGVQYPPMQIPQFQPGQFQQFTQPPPMFQPQQPQQPQHQFMPQQQFQQAQPQFQQPQQQMFLPGFPLQPPQFTPTQPPSPRK